jgi:hypothetical protein
MTQQTQAKGLLLLLGKPVIEPDAPFPAWIVVAARRFQMCHAKYQQMKYCQYQCWRAETMAFRAAFPTAANSLHPVTICN